MLVYFGIIIFLGLGSIIEQRNKKLGENFFLFSFLFLILFFGLRGYIGYDWYSYKPNFDKIPTLFKLFEGDLSILSSGYELGFQIYTSFIKTFTDNYYIYNFINSLVDFIIFYFMLKRFSKFPLLSLLLFFSIYGMALEIDMIRNAKSIMLFLVSIKYIEERNIMKFTFLNILGIFFHYSSFLYLPMYFFLNTKWNKKFIFFLFIIGNIYYFSDIRIVMKIIKEYSVFLPTGLGSKLSGYLSIIPLDFSLGFSFYYIERVVIFLICWFQDDRLRDKKYGNIMLNSLYISVFFFLYLSEFSIVATRFALLFIYSYWFVLPMLLDIYLKLLVFILIFLISVFRLNNQINFIGNKDIYQYQNILISNESEEIQRKKVESASKYKMNAHGKEISVLF